VLYHPTPLEPLSVCHPYFPQEALSGRLLAQHIPQNHVGVPSSCTTTKPQPHPHRREPTNKPSQSPTAAEVPWYGMCYAWPTSVDEELLPEDLPRRRVQRVRREELVPDVRRKDPAHHDTHARTGQSSEQPPSPPSCMSAWPSLLP
jgi:hypothetical protein